MMNNIFGGFTLSDVPKTEVGIPQGDTTRETPRLSKEALLEKLKGALGESKKDSPVVHDQPKFDDSENGFQDKQSILDKLKDIFGDATSDNKRCPKPQPDAKVSENSGARNPLVDSQGSPIEKPKPPFQHVREASVENQTSEGDSEASKSYEPNSDVTIDGKKYQTDANGKPYKKYNEETQKWDILTCTEYTIKGSTYQTDENGRKISCDSTPEYTEDGKRNNKDQKESGGDARKDGDDGGHIIAKVIGGSEGEENLVPMRQTINRGDYKKMENEISKALQEGKQVSMHIDIEYDGDSQRPSKIKVEYTIDGKKTVVEYDNEENSTDLLNSVKKSTSEEDYSNLSSKIEDMDADGKKVSVTSVKVEYDENGKSVKVTVGILDESTGEKTYEVFEPRQENLK